MKNRILSEKKEQISSDRRDDSTDQKEIKISSKNQELTRFRSDGKVSQYYFYFTDENIKNRKISKTFNPDDEKHEEFARNEIDRLIEEVKSSPEPSKVKNNKVYGVARITNSNNTSGTKGVSKVANSWRAIWKSRW